MAGAGLGPIPGDAGPDAMREAAAAWLAKINGPAGDACREDFEDWYNADPRHAEAFEAILETWEQSRLAAFTPLATSRQALRRREDKGRSGWPKVLLAAAASIGLTVAVLVGYAIHHRDASERRASELVEVASRVGEIRTLTLPDGSHVTLDTASAIRLAFAGDERRIVLERGRARFEVAHDPSRLFVVQAGNRLVIAHGTIFDVDLNEQHIAVTLLRGSVEVKRSADPADGANRSGMMLVPGQRLTWGLETASSPILSSAAASDAVPSRQPGDYWLAFGHACL
jgi:transmembrane sensor